MTLHASSISHDSGTSLTREEVPSIYILQHDLFKRAIHSNHLSHHEVQLRSKETNTCIEENYRVTTETNQAIVATEQSTKRWSLAVKIFSWVTSFIALFTGISLITTGADPLGGALFVGAGLLSLFNHFAQVTDLWGNLLESSEAAPEEKRSAILWIQIGIAALSILIIGLGIIFGRGVGVAKGAMGIVSPFGSAASQAGKGVLCIGKGKADEKYFHMREKKKENELERETLDQQQEDIATISSDNLEVTKDNAASFDKARRMEQMVSRTINNINRR